MKFLIFPNYVYKYTIKVSQQDQNFLKIIAKNYKQEYHYTTFYKDNILLLPQINDLKETLENIFDKLNLKVLHAWVQGYGEDNFHDCHTHAECMYSCVLYLDCSDKSSKTVFYHPTHPHSVMYHVKKTNIQIKPKIGKLVIFPSYLPHVVLPNKDKKRLVLSANLIQKS
tara:strand:+ start:1363 stop:1869 length:507 start_codon:yes stop_codon:yes gene_type:complete